jgi:hypothetical protein
VSGGYVKNGLLSELTVSYQPISALKTSPRNSRTHSKRQIRKIADSIEVFGFTNPILITGENRIIAGHGRFAAAKLLGMDRIPTIRLEALSPDHIRAYVLADNRLAEKAGWDKAILAIELQHLITIVSLDVTVTGFDLAEIELLVEPANDKRGGVGRVKSASSISKSGDIWLLGEHRIVCGSSPEPRSYAAIDVVIQSWQKNTGERAIHAASGKCFDEAISSSEVTRA